MAKVKKTYHEVVQVGEGVSLSRETFDKYKKMLTYVKGKKKVSEKALKKSFTV
jgi:hypothetical protein